MKIFSICVIFFSSIIAGENFKAFEKHFEDATMRIDYYHVGDSKEEIFAIDRIYREGIWAGSRKNLIDRFNNGAYYYKIYDLESGNLIFSKGFDSYFKEYQTSKDAREGIKRSYHESALIPYPRSSVKLSIEKRDENNILKAIYSTQIDPSDIMIINESIRDESVTITKSLYSGDPHQMVDVVILAEGYTADEKDKYLSDLKKFTDILIKYEPYKSLRDNFNVY